MQYLYEKDQNWKEDQFLVNLLEKHIVIDNFNFLSLADVIFTSSDV